jgi:hypothetical protein
MLTIYALVDPRNQEVRYIGQAVDVQKRYQQHVTQPGHRRQLSALWLRRLTALCLRPRLRVLQRGVPDELGYTCECYWMEQYQALGHDVLNQNGPGCKRRPHPDRMGALLTETVGPDELVGERPLIRLWKRKTHGAREWREQQREIAALTGDFLGLGDMTHE